MPLQTGLSFGLAKTNTLRGSSGEVLCPLYTENYTPQEFLAGPSDSQRTWGRVGGKVVESTLSGFEYNGSWTGLLHPNDYIRLWAAHYGIGTPAAEGTAYKHSWAVDAVGDPLPVVLLGRYSTAATSYALIEQCYINNFGLKFNLNGSLETTIGFYGTKRTIKVATPTVTIPDMSTRFKTSNVTALQTVLTFTPSGGSSDDFYAKIQTFDMSSPRTINNTGTAGGTYPSFGIPDPSPLGVETFNFTAKDTGGSLTPALKEVGYVQGNAAGILQATWAEPVSGTVTITILGGTTVADATKKYTMSFTGTGQFLGGYTTNGIFTGKIVPDNWWARSLIGDVTASPAQPT